MTTNGASGKQHSHRSGGLKQSNKKNKRTVASKRSAHKRQGGRINHNKNGGTSLDVMSNGTNSSNKVNRRNLQKQIRQKKIQQIKLQKNGGVTKSTNTTLPPQQQQSIIPQVTEKTPRMIGIISLSSTSYKTATSMEDHVQQTMSSIATTTLRSLDDTSCGCFYSVHKRDGYITYVTPKTSLQSMIDNNHDEDDDHDDDDIAMMAALDMSRTCDAILFILHDNTKEYSANSHHGNNQHDDIPMTSIDFSNDMGQKSANNNHNSTAAAAMYSGTSTSNMTTNKYDYLISTRGDRILSALKGQGLSTPITIVASYNSNSMETTTGTSNFKNEIEDDELDGMEEPPEDDVDDDMDMNQTVLTFHTTMTTKSKNRHQMKRRYDIKKYATRFATTEFGTNNNKVYELSLMDSHSHNQNVNDNDKVVANSQTDTKSNVTQLTKSSSATAAALVRAICTMTCHPPLWVSQAPRPYLINELQPYMYNAQSRTLSLSGYVRSSNHHVPLDINSLFHIPNVGTFAAKAIQNTMSPWQQQKLQQRGQRSKTDHGERDTIVVTADPDRRETLNIFATPDALDGEQNLIGFDEDDEMENDDEYNDGDDNLNNKTASTKANASNIARPAGWSDYQSAWMDSVDEMNKDNQSTSADTYTAAPIHDIDHGELADELNRKKPSSNNTLATKDFMDLVDDDYHEVTAEERQILSEQRKKQHQEESDFPDEVQVPEDIKARDRFARYRSLKSFRTSPWDAKENLPDSYATIYHFSSFKQTQRTIMNDMKYLSREAEAVQNQFFGTTHPNVKCDTVMEDGEDNDDVDDTLDGCVPSGSYVTITLENVSKDVMERVSPNALLTAVALLPHENKVSVMHMGLSQSPGCDMNEQYPIKSKDVLTFRCGWRTWQGRPVFSQNNLNCDKHKYERFLPTGGAFFAASIFGPVTYSPCPVLVFREKSPENPRRELVAIGSMLGADADRIVVKRIVLTGYPVRVHKRHATVKYMFYDPEDVKWFKPAGLHTKHGLQGNIVQSVGEHGTMKCLFNAPIKQHDTVCLPLYKRIFPKYVVSNRRSGGSDDKSRSGVTTYREHKPNLIVL